MKSKHLILWSVVIFFVFYGFVYAKPFETIQIGDGSQKYRKPVWSPDGEKLAFWGPGGIYVCNWDGSKQPKKIFGTFGDDLMWASDSELVYWQRKYWKEKQEGKKPKRMEKEFIKLVSLRGKEEIITEGHDLKGPYKLPDGTVIFSGAQGYEIIREGKLGKDALKKQYAVTSHYPPVHDSRIKGPVHEDTDVWIASLDGSFNRRVTHDKQYYFPQLSPDATKILVSKPPNADLVILDLNGNEISNPGVGVTEVSPGLFASATAIRHSWSADSKKIVYMLEVDNSKKQTIESLDLYVINGDGSGRTQITNTPNELEMDPEWAPDGTKIACWSENTGKIFVIKLK